MAAPTSSVPPCRAVLYHRPVAWTCAHQLEDRCQRLGKPCRPGTQGCVLAGAVTFAPVDDALAAAPPRSRDRSRREGSKAR